MPIVGLSPYFSLSQLDEEPAEDSGLGALRHAIERWFSKPDGPVCKACGSRAFRKDRRTVCAFCNRDRGRKPAR